MSASTQVLRQRTAELRRQRERTARVAVLAERGSVAASLDETLHAEIGRICDDAAAGRRALDTDPAAARRTLAAIEQRGRDALRQMREVLGNLGDDAPGEPQPSLEQLPALLRRSTTSTVPVTRQGSPRSLPARLELSGYRIVEHLLPAFDAAPHPATDVSLRSDPAPLDPRASG